MPTPNWIAGGTIQPSRFVIQDVSQNNAVVQASGTSDFIVGVCQEWSKLAPLPGAASDAATSGDQIMVYGLGEVCLLQSTTAGWTAGDRLTGDTVGRGLAGSSTNYYGAIALTTLTGAGLGRVQVVLGKNP